MGRDLEIPTRHQIPADGGIGKHTYLKCRRRSACEFESRFADQTSPFQRIALAFQFAALAQLGEHVIGNGEVIGSKPIGGSKLCASLFSKRPRFNLPG